MDNYDNKIAYLKEIKSRFGPGIEKIQRVDHGKSCVIIFKNKYDSIRILRAICTEYIDEKYNIHWSLGRTTLTIY